MNIFSCLVLLLECVVIVFLTGCAKPRTGPFDVPAAVPRASSTLGGVSSAAGTDVARAASEIEAARIYFAFDKSALTPESRSTLDKVAGLLKQHPSIRVGIQGHCDERGSSEYNYGLGERRARAAYNYLVQCGVPSAQLEMTTYGEESPAAAGANERSYSCNRRDEFTVLTTCY